MSGEALAVEGLRVGYGRGAPVLDGLDLRLPAGRITALVGPNGSGKSTLLQALAGAIAPRAGTVRLGADDLARLPARARARRLAFLPQRPEAAEGLTVAELAALGRHSHRGPFARWSHADQAALDAALAATALDGLAHREVQALSGGQRQRAFLAMTLAQGAPTLLLDEPTTFLDIGHQLEVLRLVRGLNATRGLTVVAALHDLGQAASLAHHVVALEGGRVAAEGPPERALAPAVIERLFGVRARLVRDPSGHAALLPMEPLGGEPESANTLASSGGEVNS